ncbi:MAG: DUF2163 domain-containing protein [Pseudomonadota bacterium]
MRPLSDRLATALDAPLASLAFLWRVQRRDGTALGFTTHDRTLTFGGLDYRPAPGMTPSTVTASTTLDVEGLDVAGVLSSDAITARDIQAGRYDGAAVTLTLIDWTDPAAGGLDLMQGSLGTLTVMGDMFEADLKTPTAALSRVPVELTSPECRARLGDDRCRIDLAKHRARARIVAVTGPNEVEIDLDDSAGRFAYGVMRPSGGALAGIDIGIARAAGSLLTLNADANGLAPGDPIRLTEGCDRRWVTCRARFANGANFRGEPYVPGRDSVLRYPGL